MTDQEQFSVTFFGTGRKAKSPANPDYPNGIDIDLSKGWPSCSVLLPYPAPGVGQFIIECRKCKANGLVTAAGRRDDPRSLKVPCKLQVN